MAGLELGERLEWVKEERRLSQVEARVARAKLCEVLVKQEMEMAGDTYVVLVSTCEVSSSHHIFRRSNRPIL